MSMRLQTKQKQVSTQLDGKSTANKKRDIKNEAANCLRFLSDKKMFIHDTKINRKYDFYGSTMDEDNFENLIFGKNFGNNHM